MEDDRLDEVVELDPERTIAIEISREWPRYVATWSIRRQVGESDYPVQSGRIERMPPQTPEELDGMLEILRSDARAAAVNAARTSEEEQVGRGDDSLLGRLFRRKTR
jgi:hypothetical protein